MTLPSHPSVFYGVSFSQNPLQIHRPADFSYEFLDIWVLLFVIQVSQVRELIEVNEVITPYGRSGS